MSLSGLQIYKLLPKTNCKECGFPTCLAFAMKLAQKGVELSACPYVSEEAKEALAAAAAPPIRLVTIGAGDKKISVGNETVLFRHEKTFYHEPGLMLRLTDTTPLPELEAQVKQASSFQIERVGVQLRLNGFAIDNVSGNPDTFAACVKTVATITDLPLILMSENPEALKAGLQALGDRTPMLYAATATNWEAMTRLAKAHNVPLAVRGDGDLSTLATLTKSCADAGLQDLVIDPGTRGMADSLAALTQLRRLALKKNFRPLGYPIITFPGQGASSLMEEAILAAQSVAKYGGFIVLDHFDPAVLYPLLTLRQNIYTDPQKPIQVSPGLYDINNPIPESPLMVTTNFSLTYFSVAGEVEGSNMPGWLLVADAEGMSVLTAWAAGKFDAAKIAKAVKDFNVESKIAHRKIIIPGFVSVLVGDLEEELPGWEILVGPREAVDLPAYLRVWK